MPGRFYDEWQEGETVAHALRRTVTETDNLLISTLTHNPQPLHLDAEAAAATEFGQILVNSCFTFSLLVGASVAFELLLTGRRVDAQDAYRIGLAGQVVPDAELLPAALTLARQVAAHSPMGLRMTKEVMWAQLEVASLRAGIDLENRTQILTTYTRDHPEAVAALLERRPATFSDS